MFTLCRRAARRAFTTFTNKRLQAFPSETVAGPQSGPDISPKPSKRKALPDGPGLGDFLRASAQTHARVHEESKRSTADLPPEPVQIHAEESQMSSMSAHLRKKVFLEIYGCQMNTNDAEIVLSILEKAGYEKTTMPNEADAHLLFTCSIRDKAEKRIWQRLSQIKGDIGRRRKSQEVGTDVRVGVLGCMAERLKEQLFKANVVDVVCGPDAYRDLPRLLGETGNSKKSANTLLSLDETYADIAPLRIDASKSSAYVTIMRGCDNMCTFCVVPFVRGRERSRPVTSILDEVARLRDNGVKDITLLGQNVNSYQDIDPASMSLFPTVQPPPTKPQTLTPSEREEAKRRHMTPGFQTVYRPKVGGVRFVNLLEECSRIAPEVRFRFTSPHPKDFPPDLLQLIRDRPNICSQLHLPLQSGSTTVLERMRRGYSKESFLDLAERARAVIPGVSLSTDVIAGFCGETEEEHRDTLEVMEKVAFEMAFMFAYSARDKTPAMRRYKDDVPEDVKKRRLAEIIQSFKKGATAKMKSMVGSIQLVLVEGPSKRNEAMLTGRTDGNHVCVFDRNIPIADGLSGLCKRELERLSIGSMDGNTSESQIGVHARQGDFVAVRITDATVATLYGGPLARTHIQEFDSVFGESGTVGIRRN
ncbi:CDK5 regulatory subunit associated protein 1 [Quaeritorhiza haematococci]|nr:CDK5 regulatory subunit associated protein 1 [Quaeritorhiza haematococci]